MGKNVLILSAFLVLFTLVGVVKATDRAPTYDYNSGKFNVTCANSPLYNVNNRSYDFGPSGNQYCTLANNLTTTEIPLSTTPISIIAWINLNSENAAGQAYTIATSGYNFTSGSGTQFKIEFNNTKCLRTQIIRNGTFYTGAFSCGFQNKTWIPIMEVYNGSSCIGYINSSANVSLNTSCNAAYLANGVNATLADRMFGEGVGGGGANGMWNGTMKYVQLYNRTVSGAEFDNYILNNTISTTGLLYSFSFENTTSTNITINLSQSIRTLPNNFMGLHSGSSPLTIAWCYNSSYALCNTSEAQAYLVQQGLGLGNFYRKPPDLTNIVSTYNGNGNVTWTTTTGPGQNYKNINIHRNLLSFAVNNSAYVLWNIDDIPVQLANNSSGCNYGVTASDAGTCDPSNWTALNHVIAQFLIDVGCYNYTSGVCALEGFNEPYWGSFYMSNLTNVSQTAPCTTRIGMVNNFWNRTGKKGVSDQLTLMGYDPSTIRYFGSPAFTNESSACGDLMGKNWSTTFPKGSTYGADMFIEHTYTSQCSDPASNGLSSSDAANQATANLGGYNTSWGITEGNIICNGLNNNTNNNSQYSSYLIQDIIYKIYNTYNQFNTIFKDTSLNTASNESQNYVLFRGSNLTVNNKPTITGAYIALNHTKYLYNNKGIYNCTSTTTTSATCLFQLYNNTNGLLIVNNKLNNQLDIDAVNIASNSTINITSATELVSTTSGTIVSGYLDPGYVPLYGTYTYNITFTQNNQNISFSGYSPSTNPSINTNQQQTFSYSINNPSSITTNTNWYQNGTNISSCYQNTACTVTGSTQGVGTFNITAIITSTTNNLSISWSETVTAATTSDVFAICGNNAILLGVVGIIIIGGAAAWAISDKKPLSAMIAIGLILVVTLAFFVLNKAAIPLCS